MVGTLSGGQLVPEDRDFRPFATDNDRGKLYAAVAVSDHGGYHKAVTAFDGFLPGIQRESHRHVLIPANQLYVGSLHRMFVHLRLNCGRSQRQGAYYKKYPFHYSVFIVKLLVNPPHFKAATLASANFFYSSFVPAKVEQRPAAVTVRRCRSRELPSIHGSFPQHFPAPLKNGFLPAGRAILLLRTNSRTCSTWWFI
jgi:hypothetical protein